MTGVTGIKLFLLLSIIALGLAQPLKCKFKAHKKAYICFISESSGHFDGKLINVESITGDHITGRHNKDVNMLVFKHIKNLGHMPHGFEKFFPNIRAIGMCKVNLKEIDEDCIKNYHKLTTLHATRNHITTLTGDLFKANKNMKCINFSNNPISNIDPNTFDGLEHLNRLGLEKLKCKEELGDAKGRPNVIKLIAKVKSGVCKKATYTSVLLQIFE